MLQLLLIPWKSNRKEMQTDHIMYGNLIKPLPLPLDYHNNVKIYREPDVRSILCGNSNTVDLGCGIGMSTAPGAIGVDEDEVTLAIARRMYPFKHFVRGDLEDWGRDDMIDTVVCSFVLSSKSQRDRRMIMENGYRICSENFMILDYGPDGTSKGHIKNKHLMNYMQNIEREIYKTFPMFFRIDILSKNVVLWYITKIK